jgi:hypothetical protein
MIGAIDMPKAERDRLREARKVEARKEKRRAAGVRSRADYESNARALRAEAAALGISPDALRKRRQRAASALSQVRPHHKDLSLIAGVTLGTPSPAAPLRPAHEDGLVFVGAQGDIDRACPRA